ncbi:carboxypeptidase-like regulatory domain-containing protein [Mariniflexile sp. HMF6888]|uniref:carboxypeptidase-like regulatory domain-containing protein n=1 Tax=Mariniflexile sp. HMF6888 TaxID=3373086 RepID=UPI00378F0332
MNFKIVILLAVLSICFISCKTDDAPDSTVCTEQFVYGLNITLKDATTSNIINSDVEVIATDGNHQETLMTGYGSDSFFGAGERPGTYIVTVTSPNYQTFTSDPITLISDKCHVIPKTFEFSLQPK